VEVGYVQVVETLVAVLHRGKLVEIHRPMAEPMALIERAGELHVLSYRTEAPSDTWMTSALWEVLAIGPDGTLRQDVMEEDTQYSWSEPREFHDATFTTFGVRGGIQSNPDEKPRPMEQKWRRDKRKKRYLSLSHKKAPAKRGRKR
jgi:hypothetical protein